jgi:hypothetical protein
MLVLQTILLAGVASAGVIRRATTASNLQTIDNDTRSLTKAEQNYNDGLSAALAIKIAADNVDDDIRSATTDAQSSVPFDEATAQSAIDYVNSTLEPDVATAVDALIGKKPYIQRDGQVCTVNDELKRLRADTQTYGNALKNIAPADRQADADADAALAKVDADYKSCVDAYAS